MSARLSTDFVILYVYFTNSACSIICQSPCCAGLIRQSPCFAGLVRCTASVQHAAQLCSGAYCGARAVAVCMCAHIYVYICIYAYTPTPTTLNCLMGFAKCAIAHTNIHPGSAIDTVHGTSLLTCPDHHHPSLVLHHSPIHQVSQACPPCRAWGKQQLLEGS